MSPRKKPRKQQLTGVELTESRCTEVVMEFVTEEKVTKEIKEESKEKSPDKRHIPNMHRDIKSPTQQAEVTIRLRPMPSLLGGTYIALDFILRIHGSYFMFSLCTAIS